MDRMDISKARIGWLALAAAILTAPAFARADETHRYIEVRDRAVQKLKGDEEHGVREWRELQARMRKLIGPLRRKGFGGQGEFNLHDLSGGFGFGRIDGLEFVSRDKRTDLLVTNQALVTDWLAKYYDPSAKDVPLDVLLSREPAKLLTWGWGIEDQHFSLVHRLPVEKPKGVMIVAAFLGNLSADDANYIPGNIIAVVGLADRVYFVSQRLTTPLPAFEECDRRWEAVWYSKRSDFDDAAFAEFNECYMAHVVSTPEFGAAGKQAQTLVEDFAR
jgi:hypothetical protein